MAVPARRTALALAALLTVPVLVVVAGALGLSLLLGGGGQEQQPTGPVCGLRPAGDAGTLTVPMTPGTFRLTSGFGPRTNPVTGTRQGHQGQDLAAPAGTPFSAAADGVVVEAGPAGGFGQWIVIDHLIDGRTVSTVYGHMWPDGVGVTAGEQVEAGQVIGRVGSNGQSTGPHLHFEVWEGGRLSGGRAVDPVGVLAEPGPDRAPATPSAVAVAAEVAAAAPTAAELVPVTPSTAQRGLALTEEQLRNAATIVAVGKGMGLPPRAWVIAIATALQESTLVNLDYGDRDSVGLFQQRPSQGWGTVAQIMDPEYSARKFYEAFVRVVGTGTGWQAEPLTELAQEVQRSGFPDAYAKWESVAANAVLAVHGVAPIDGPAPPSCV